VYGRVSGDEERVEKEKPGKYFYRLFPVSKEVLLLMASFDEEFRKEYGIRLDNYFHK
jgi:hypothetical protein